ncbi:docking domain of Afi1 for Arf3 in vesicle trafficking-domain-containing protein [Pisolithus croceorrhizus]|nr:docking domain of Afi1 for Arf3 in vesicle trafficking-domain-containing protein [Pisolithus croceorrhizus]
MATKGPHCSFVLLAEFDIDSGAQLTYQFPQPLGTDEGLLANLMLPDGAERHFEDWTIFFLNQTPFNTIAPVLALETHEPNDDHSSAKGSHSELIYVLNLVRTKHDKSVRRGAVVKAMAICTRHPFIQIFKPVLLLALDDYFASPSQDCLARLFDAINSMDISTAPVLTRFEKLIMRASERKDIFSEKFAPSKVPDMAVTPLNGSQATRTNIQHQTTSSSSSHSSEESIVAKNRNPYIDGARDQTAVESSTTSLYQQQHHPSSPSDSSFSLGGSAVWVNDESVILDSQGSVASGSGTLASRGRRSTDASSSSSSGLETDHTHGAPIPTASDSQLRSGISKDTHFFQTSIIYREHHLPIKLPLATFPEEVGDYSLMQLIQTFSTPQVTVSGPLHPHLHSNGNLTHAIIILFNALVTGKRVLFLGHNIPAGQVASYVLSACALGSGCGVAMRGFIERAFPYAGLAEISTSTFPTTPPAIGPLLTRQAIRAENSAASEEEIARIATRDRETSQKTDFTAKADSLDNIFMEDIISAITSRFGENVVRLRFIEYVVRFVRLASRYEEVTSGTTKLFYPSAAFGEGSLGSGVVFPDEAAALKELAANASRIEGWRRTKLHQYCVSDFQRFQATNSIKGFDLTHQLSRLRFGKNLPDVEVELIMRKIAENVRSYEQVVELLAHTPLHLGGLQPLSFCLFHQQEVVREAILDVFNELRAHPVGVMFLQALNHFQRYAYVRQAHARETRSREQVQQLMPPLPYVARTPSSRSEISLGGI